MPGDDELMRMHVEALFAHDAQGRMICVNEPNGAPAPRFFLGRTAGGSVVRVRQDIDDDLRRELEEACGNDASWPDMHAPVRATRYEEILSRFAPVRRTWLGPAYQFPPELHAAHAAVMITEANEELLRPLLQEWLPDVRLSQPMAALAVDGRAVSICGSVRKTAMAHEAGVETVPAFRGRGYAAQVVRAWARAVRDMGRVPLYSTSWQNVASRGVARKVGLVAFGSDLHIT